MKFLVLILGSTTLAAGGSAITSQQDVHTDVTQLRPHQLDNTRMVGDDCPWVETPIFDTVAHPLVMNNCVLLWERGSAIDLDGDGVPESMTGNIVLWQPGALIDSPACKTRYIPNSNPTAISHEIFLSLNPKNLIYEGSAQPLSTSLVGYLDVTNDGKPDAIIKSGGGQTEVWFVENISEWPAACASDINNDDVTDVVDLLEVVGNWGPCE